MLLLTFHRRIYKFDSNLLLVFIDTESRRKLNCYEERCHVEVLREYYRNYGIWGRIETLVSLQGISHKNAFLKELSKFIL